MKTTTTILMAAIFTFAMTVKTQGQTPNPRPVPAPKESWKSYPQFQFTPQAAPNWYALELENDPVYWSGVNVNRVIISLKKGVDKEVISALIAKYQLRYIRSSMYPNTMNFFSYELPNSSRVKVLQLVKEAKQNPVIEYVEPESIITTNGCSYNDPYLYPNSGWKQWGLHNTGIDSAWCLAGHTGTWGQWVGVIDNACDYTHSDFGVMYEYDFADMDANVLPDGTGTQTHGTHVAGIVGGRINNGIGIAGVSNDTLYFAKAMKNGASVLTDAAIVDALNDMALRPQVRVINMSFGATGPSAMIHTACDNAYLNNKLLIASAGNDASGSIRYPAAYSSVICVGATGVNPTTFNNVFASAYSNYGAKQELSAPGGNGDGSMWDIWSTVPSNSYQYKAGTSMAAPLITGVAALMFDAQPALTNVEVRALLQASVYDLGPAGLDPQFGYGMICGWCAVYNAQHYVIPTCDVPTGISASGITTTSALVSWLSTGATSYNIHYRVAGSPTWATATTTSTSVTFSGLASSTIYEYQIQSDCSGIGLSSYSTIANFTTLTPTCSTPSGISVTGITTTSSVINWLSTGATSYNVQYRVSGGSAWTTIATSGTSITLSGLNPSTVYEYQVQSDCISDGLTSTYSPISSFTTDATPCSTPSGLTATYTTVSATLNWSTVPDAVSYNIRYVVFGGSTWVYASSSTNSITISGLVPNTAYNFEVRTACSSVPSEWSVPIGFKTQALPMGINASGNSEEPTIYPNPITGKFYVELPLTGNASVNISIVDVSGKTVKTLYNDAGKSGKNLFTFDRSGIANGVYFLAIKSNNELIKYEKVVVN